MFLPAQVVAVEGDTVVLNFVGAQGPSHRIAIEGREGEIVLKRGETKSVVLDGVKPGVIRFASLDRLPSMVGQSSCCRSANDALAWSRAARARLILARISAPSAFQV